MVDLSASVSFDGGETPAMLILFPAGVVPLPAAAVAARRRVNREENIVKKRPAAGGALAVASILNARPRIPNSNASLNSFSLQMDSITDEDKMTNICSDIEAELEAELANRCGFVRASYQVTDLDDGCLSSDDDSHGVNPLSLLGGFNEFALCVQEAEEVKDRAAAVVAKSESILENDRYETDGNGRMINDEDVRSGCNDEDAGGGCNDEHLDSDCIDTSGRVVASSEKSVIHSALSLFSSAKSDEVSVESDVSSIGNSSATLSAHESVAAANRSTTNMRPPSSSSLSSSSSESSPSQPRENGITVTLNSTPLSPPPTIESPLESNEYDNELRAIEQEAIGAEISRQERSRRAQILRDTALAETRKVFELQTGSAIAIQAMVRRTFAKEQVKRIRRALQVEAHLISVHNHVSVRRAMSTMQSYSSELRRESFQTARTWLQLHLLDRRERHNASAIIIQCCFRRCTALRSATLILSAVVALQGFLRCKQSKGNFRRLQSSAIAVQRFVRARTAEKEAAAKKIEGSAMCIQRVARGFVAWRGYRCARGSVITLQRCYRGQRARRQLTAIQCSSFAFDDEEEINIEDLIGGIRELGDEPDDAFLESRHTPRRWEKPVDVSVASSAGTSTPETNQIATSEKPPSTAPAIEPLPSSAASTDNTSANVKTLPSTNDADTTPTGTGGWGVRVARAFSERGQNMLPGTRRRRNNNRSRREGQSRWR